MKLNVWLQKVYKKWVSLIWIWSTYRTDPLVRRDQLQQVLKFLFCKI